MDRVFSLIRFFRKNSTIRPTVTLIEESQPTRCGHTSCSHRRGWRGCAAPRPLSEPKPCKMPPLHVKYFSATARHLLTSSPNCLLPSKRRLSHPQKIGGSFGGCSKETFLYCVCYQHIMMLMSRLPRCNARESIERTTTGTSQ